KSYPQIFHNFRLTCELRYGVAKEVKLCREAGKFEARTDAMTQVISEELGRGDKQPFTLLADVHQVRSHLMRLVYLFSPYLRQTLERQGLADLDGFEKQGHGAELVAAFALAADAQLEYLNGEAAAARRKFLETRRERLEKALLDPSCDVECRGQAAEV